MSKKEKKGKHGLVIKINDDISIYANRWEFIVKYRDYENWYLPSLEACFEEILDEQVKVKFIKNDKKDMENIIRIIKETKKELLALFEGCGSEFK